MPVPAAAQSSAEDEQQDAGRDPSVPIFTPATPSRDEDRRPAAARSTGSAAPRNVNATASPKQSPAQPAEARRREGAPAEPARPAAAEPAFTSGSRPLRTDKRPGALDKNGKPLTPYVVAARILDEREEQESLTPEALVRALADEGLNVNAAMAQELLRELRPPLASRLSSQRSGAAGDGRSPVDGRPVAAGVAAKAKDRG